MIVTIELKFVVDANQRNQIYLAQKPQRNMTSNILQGHKILSKSSELDDPFIYAIWASG